MDECVCVLLSDGRPSSPANPHAAAIDTTDAMPIVSGESPHPQRSRQIRTEL